MVEPYRHLHIAPLHKSTPGFKAVFYLVGLVLVATAGMMLFPMAVDLYYGNREWRVFAASALVTASVGACLAYGSKGALKDGLTIRQAFTLTPLSWFSVAAASAVPFYLAEYGSVSGDASNAMFEAVSGITTTGATVLSGLDDAPPGLLLWRALLQWLGGIGIIVTAIAILPTLGIGGMQLFRTESSDRSEKALPRMRQFAIVLGLVYLGLTVLAALSYWLAGMRPFEAIAHALTSISTGGYSTSDASFGKWEENGIQWMAAVFMLAGSLPFVLYVRFIAGERKALWDRQVKTMLAAIGVVALMVGTWLLVSGQYAFEAAFRHAVFNVVSVVTTTGFATADYSLWGNAVLGVFFVLLFVGGCTGSTSGGMKIFRLEVMAVMLKGHFMRLLYPNGVFSRTYGERTLSDDVVGSVAAFMTVFLLVYAVVTVVLMGFNLDFMTSASSAATALSNVGPGLGPIVGPAGNFSALPDGAKWVLCLSMLLGRLEIFTLLILFLPRFWRG